MPLELPFTTLDFKLGFKRDNAACGLKTSLEVMAMAEKLDVGDSFPEIKIAVTSGGFVTLPIGLDGRYKVILFYRGHW